MSKEGNTKVGMGRFAVPALFLLSISLVITLSIVSLTYKNAPTIASGASVEDVSEYAQKLVDGNQGNAETFDEAAIYFTNQISKAPSEQDQFNLKLSYATFLGDNGDFEAAIGVLDEIPIEDLPLDARYYLYSTYIYLYDQIGDVVSSNDYRMRIVDEGIDIYLASLDGAEIEEGEECTIELLEEDEQIDAEENPEEETEDEEEEIIELGDGGANE